MVKLYEITSFGYVALFTRAWIEINNNRPIYGKLPVALFTRAWIEIRYNRFCFIINCVALFTRAWIEILFCVYFL